MRRLRSRQIQLNDVVVDTEIDGHRFDILGYVDGHSLAFVFTHPGRDRFHRLDNFEDTKSGVVEIALDELKDQFRKLQTPDKSYGDILSKYISNDIKSKKWIYHPRQRRAQIVAESKLKVALEKVKKRSISSPRIYRERSRFDDGIFQDLGSLQKTDISDDKFRFICRLCNSTWDGVGNADASCAKCGNALLVSRVELDS